MVSRCALILLLGVCLQSTTCARLKRSTTQRKLAHASSIGGEPELVSSNSQNIAIEPEPEHVLVSDSLIDEKDKITSIVLDEEARLKEYHLNLASAHADLQYQRELLETESKIWKVWNYRIWSDKLKKIEKEIARLEGSVGHFTNLITTVTDQIKDLNDAKDWVHNAAERAKHHESLISGLHDELSVAKQVHADTVEAYESAERQAKEDGDEKLKVYEKQLADLEKDIAELQAELQALNDGMHGKQQDMVKAREELENTIKEHQELIASYEARLLDNELKTKNAKKNRKQSKDEFEAVLGELRADREKLKEEVAKARPKLEAGKKQLAETIAEKTGQIEALRKQLQDEINKLGQDIEDRKTIIYNQKTANENRLLALKADFNEEIASKTRQLNEFLAAKTDALNALKALKDDHAEVADGAVVSAALHKARDDLESKRRLEEDVQATAELNRDRKKAEKAIKEAELKDADKIWKVWNWGIWSDKKSNLRAVIRSLTAGIAAEDNKITNAKHLIQLLTTQIASKLDASKLAEAEEVAIEELEKQISDKEAERNSVQEEEQAKLPLEKAAGADLVQTFVNMLEELKAQRSTAASTLQKLDDGEHDKNMDLQEAKATIEKIIKTHDDAIKNLTAAIAVSESNEAELQQAEDKDVDDHEIMIAGLREDTNQTGKDKQLQEGYKKAAEGRLTEAEAAHGDAVKESNVLKDALNEAIGELQLSRTQVKDTYETEKLQKEKLLELEKERQFKDTEVLQNRIRKLTESKVEAEDAFSDHLENMQDERSKKAKP